MYGMGIVKGLGVTLKHFLATYVDDLRWFFERISGGSGGRYYNPEALRVRQGPKARGIFTVQYPEEKLVLPEEFRFLPFLIYDVDEAGHQHDRCTSCGICAKVCPPQCIWIERANDPTTGRPIPEPVEFYIDVDICMNCGLCAEYCPFDAIKMDHDYELATFDRMSHHIFDKARLSQPASYYASIRPTNNAREEAAQAAKDAAKEAKAAKAEGA